MKKEWIKPEIKDLNLENTYEDGLIDCPNENDDTSIFSCPPFGNGNSDGNDKGNKKCNFPRCNHKVKGNGYRCKCHLNYHNLRKYKSSCCVIVKTIITAIICKPTGITETVS